jgi:hypothetical protein
MIYYLKQTGALDNTENVSLHHIMSLVFVVHTQGSYYQ